MEFYLVNLEMSINNLQVQFTVETDNKRFSRMYIAWMFLPLTLISECASVNHVFNDENEKWLGGV